MLSLHILFCTNTLRLTLRFLLHTFFLTTNIQKSESRAALSVRSVFDPFNRDEQKYIRESKKDFVVHVMPCAVMMKSGLVAFHVNIFSVEQSIAV